MSAAHGATFTIGAEAANARAVTVQLTDAMRKALANKAIASFYVSTDAAGLEPVDFSTDDTVPTVGTKGAVLGGGGDGELRVISAADGIVDLVLTNASDQAKTRYLHAIVANDHIVAAGAISFIDNP